MDIVIHLKKYIKELELNDLIKSVEDFEFYFPQGYEFTSKVLSDSEIGKEVLDLDY